MVGAGQASGGRQEPSGHMIWRPTHVGREGQSSVEVAQDPSGQVTDEVGHCLADAQAASTVLEAEPGGARRQERSVHWKNPGGQTMP